MGSIHKLEPDDIENAKPGDHHDGGGLYLQVKKTGAKSWVYRFTLNGCRHKMGLGTPDVYTPAEVREEHRKAKQQVGNGINPIEARKKKRRDERVAEAQRITLAEARDQWLKVQDWHPSSVYRETWVWKLYGPKLGPCVLSDLADGNRIVEVFTEVIHNKRYKKSARYALQQLRSTIDWAKDEGNFAGDNPVNLRSRPKSKFLRRLPSLDYEKKPRRAMPWQEVPAFVARLRAERGHGSVYSADERPLPTEVIELQILTGGRPVQARLAKWDEFDLDNQTWKVPHTTTTPDGKTWHRRKRKEPFELYINRPAVDLLRTIKKRQEVEGGLREFVFSHRPALAMGESYHPTHAWRRRETSKYGDSEFRFGGMPINAGAVNSYFRDAMGVKNCDLHGFRGSFKQWSIAHGYNDLAGEAVLDHQVGNYVRNVYAQGAQPYLEIIEMTDHWGQHCDGKKTSGAVIRGRFQKRR